MDVKQGRLVLTRFILLRNGTVQIESVKSDIPVGLVEHAMIRT